MRFKSSQTPPIEINLVPMLNVMMGILAFFVTITMTLTAERGVEVDLPSSQNSSPPPANAPAPLLVNLTPQGILLDNQPATQEQVLQQVQTYLEANPEGFVVLQADEQLQYDRVVSLLGEMKELGGDQVSLAIDDTP